MDASANFPRPFVYGSIVVALFILLGAAYFLVLQRTSEPATATIVFSGPLALESTKGVLQSVQLALDEVNYYAGNISLQLEVFEGGDETGAWDPQKEERNANAAASIENVVAYFGPINSGAAKISMPILNMAGIVQISPATTWPGLTKIGFLPGEPGVFYPTGVRHFVRVSTTDDLQGPAGAQWARDLGFNSVYIFDDGDAYGIGIAQLFEAEAKRRRIEVVGRASISSSSDFDAVAADIAKSNADIVYYGGTTPNGGPELLIAIRSLDIKAAFMGPDGIFEEDFLMRAGNAAEGIYVTSVGIPPEEIKTEDAERYLEKYRSQFNKDPDVFGAMAYDAAKLLIEAIARTGSTDRAKILREVRGTRSYKGLSGTWGFDSNGDTTAKLISGSRVEEGRFTFITDLSG